MEDRNSSAADDLGAVEFDAAKRSMDAKKDAAGKTGAAGALAAEKAAGGVGATGGAGKGFYSGSGKSMVGGKGAGVKGGKMKKITAGVAVGLILVAVIGVVIVGALGLPITMIASIDYGLQSSLGFDDTTAIMEEQAEYITAEEMAKGRVPDGYANDLAAHGISVGQVTAAGDFVRTNVYIANIEELDEVAVVGSGYHMVAGEDGRLAMLFEGEVVTADNFVATVESNPRMYAAYAEALDISAKYYYSSEVSEVYKEMGLSRGNFNSWQQTGDYEADQASFDEMLVKTLGDTSTTETSGFELYDVVACMVDGEERTDTYSYDFSIKTSGDKATKTIENVEHVGGGGDCPASVSSGSEELNGAEEISGALASLSRGIDVDNATKSAATLLNSAISANEPYMAAKAFLAIEEPIQRARIDGDGPVNEVMNTISRSTEITYTDVATGEEKTITKSILDTRNFSAAVANEDYSKEEAANFSRDRVMYLTGAGGDLETTSKTTVSLDSGSKPDGLTKTMYQESVKPNGSTLSKTTNSIDVAITKSNSDTFTSVVGGNRVVEGGAFLSSTINQRVIGAMPSDVATVVSYHDEVKTVLARRVEAEQATKSPFDVTSPYTFMGSLVREIGTSMVAKGGYSGASPVASVVGAAVDLASDSVASLTSGANAEGEEDDDFATTMGNCTTVKAASAEGNLYCSSHNTVSTAHMSWTEEQWKSNLSGQLSSDGSIEKNSELAQFTIMGMDREATVGVESAEVCNTYRDMNDNFIQKLIHKALDIFELYNACENLSDDGRAAATGAKYVLHDSESDVALYSGYALYDKTKSLMGDGGSTVTAFKERYYAEHPRDNSRVGVVARRSGLTKSEAETALAYADYLTFLAQYDASEVYAFGQEIDLGGKAEFIKTNDKMAAELALAGKMRELVELRQRTLATVV